MLLQADVCLLEVCCHFISAEICGIRDGVIHSRNDQNYVLICTTPLFYILPPTYFSSSLPSSGNFLDPSELLEIQIKWVVCHIICGYMTCVPECHSIPAHRPRNHTLYVIPPIRFVFQVTQKDLRSSLMMAGCCQNM
jgi:hypothetical protein